MTNQIPQKLMATTIKRIIKTHDKRARDRLHAFSEVGALAVPSCQPCHLGSPGISKGFPEGNLERREPLEGIPNTSFPKPWVPIAPNKIN